MYKFRAEISAEKLLKVSTSLILCLLLVAVPFIERCHAVAAVDDLAVLIIVTILLSMGISLVLDNSQTPESFLNSRFPLFKQAQDVEIIGDTLGSWLMADAAQTFTTLKDGILSIPKTVTQKAKQFIGWLIPDPVSNSVVDFNNGSVIPVSQAIFSGTIVQGSGGYANFKATGVFTPSSDYAESISDGTNTVTFVSKSRIRSTGRYQASTGIYSPTPYSFSANGSNFFVLCLCSEAFINQGNTCLPGIYFGQASSNSTQIQFNSQSASNLDYLLQINELTVTAPSSDASAIIGDYDDISGIRDVSKDISGTTVIENQFQITSAGQALNPSGESLDDIVNALRQALENLNQKAEVMAVTDAVAEAGTISPDYGDFDLGQIDLSGLGALLTTRFPFCIPWDIGRIFGLFVADPEPPVWEVDLLPIDAFEGVDTTITLDLGQYPIVGQISRWFCIIDLCIGLCYVTKRFVWVA